MVVSLLDRVVLVGGMVVWPLIASKNEEGWSFYLFFRSLCNSREKEILSSRSLVPSRVY